MLTVSPEEQWLIGMDVERVSVESVLLACFDDDYDPLQTWYYT